MRVCTWNSKTADSERIGRLRFLVDSVPTIVGTATETLDHLLSTEQWPEYDDYAVVLTNQNVVGGRQSWTGLGGRGRQKRLTEVIQGDLLQRTGATVLPITSKHQNQKKGNVMSGDIDDGTYFLYR